MSNRSNQNLSNREKFLIAALFAAVLIICLFKLGRLSTFEAMRNLYLEQSQIRAEIEQLDAVISNEQQLTASYQEKSAERLRYEKVMPSTDQQPASIGDLEKLIYSSSGSLIAMRVNESYDYGDYSAQNISLKIGNLNTFPDDLIMKLQNFPQLLIIEQLEWQTEETEAGTINLSLSLYYLN